MLTTPLEICRIGHNICAVYVKEDSPEFQVGGLRCYVDPSTTPLCTPLEIGEHKKPTSQPALHVLFDAC